MYFGGEPRGQTWWETTNVWKDRGRLHHDHATIKLKTILEPTIVFFNFIKNHYVSALVQMFFSNSLFLHIVCPVTPLYINAIIDLYKVCDPSCVPLFVVAWHWVLFIVFVSSWYSCKKWSLVEEDSSNRPFEFHFDEKKWTLVARFT